MKTNHEFKKYFSFLKTVSALLLVVGVLTGCQVDMKANPGGTQQNHNAKPTVAALPGQMAPQFSLQTFFAPKVITLTDLLGQKPILINVFASWCNPCKIEAPFIEQGYKRLGNQIEFIGVNATSQELNVKAPIDFIKKYQISFPVLKDKDGTFLDHYAVMGLPTTYLLSPNGKVINVKVGAFTSLNELMSFVHSSK